MTEAPASQMLVGNNVFKEFKGAFTEQFILQQLVSMGISTYNWSSDSAPTEVKAEENVRAKSMSEYIKSHPQYALKGLRISMLGYQEQDWMENIPLFQAYEKVKVIFYRHYKTFLQNSGRCF